MIHWVFISVKPCCSWELVGFFLKYIFLNFFPFFLIFWNCLYFISYFRGIFLVTSVDAEFQKMCFVHFAQIDGHALTPAASLQETCSLVMKSWSSFCPWAEIEDLSTPQCAWTYCRLNLRQLSRRMSLRRKFVFTQVSGWSLHQIPLGHSQEPPTDYVWALALIGNVFNSLFRDFTVPLSPSTVLENTCLTMATAWQVQLAMLAMMKDKIVRCFLNSLKRNYLCKYL